MNKFLLIFALLIASCDEKQPIPFKSVAIQISDANPIQFWPVDCETYNEKEVCGVHPKCWCHPWQCDDEITTQFTNNDPLAEYDLAVYNDDEEIDRQQFSSYNIYNTDFVFYFANAIFDGSLVFWSQYSDSPGSSAGWAWSFGDVAAVDGTSGSLSQSYELYQGRAFTGIGGYGKFPPGTYTFRLVMNNHSTGGMAPLQEGLVVRAFDTPGVLGELVTITIPRDGVTLNYDVTLTTTQEWDNFSFQLYKQGPSSGSIIKVDIAEIRIIAYPLDYTLSVYDLSIVPSDFSPDLCDKRVRFEIIETSSDDLVVLKSDCIDIASVQKCTTLIEYSNNRNFAGLIYENASPEQLFNIRVPAIFFHEQFPEEDEGMDLTTGLVKTSGTLKAQRLFETDYMPYYMHRKLMLIFKHQTINIESLAWIKEEKYEIQEGDRRWPVKKAKCFLNENYIQRAVL